MRTHETLVGDEQENRLKVERTVLDFLYGLYWLSRTLKSSSPINVFERMALVMEIPEGFILNITPRYAEKAEAEQILEDGFNRDVSMIEFSAKAPLQIDSITANTNETGDIELSFSREEVPELETVLRLPNLASLCDYHATLQKPD
jgi:hypothetical protein